MNAVIIKAERCIGCRHCEVACALEHSQSKTLLGMLTETPGPAPRIFVETGIRFLTFPNRCQHCDPAPCMQVCPTKAIYRDEETGAVLVNEEKCIACGGCAMVCPFGIIQFRFQPVVDREVNSKCDFCIERQKAGNIPACVEACKTGALEFGDMNTLVRQNRKDFSLRFLKSKGPEVETVKVPENILAFRKVMEEIANMGPFKGE